MTDRKRSESKAPEYSFKPNLSKSASSVSKALSSARRVKSPISKGEKLTEILQKKVL
jgi:hypothetical protein